MPAPEGRLSKCSKRDSSRSRMLVLHRRARHPGPPRHPGRCTVCFAQQHGKHDKAVQTVTSEKREAAMHCANGKRAYPQQGNIMHFQSNNIGHESNCKRPWNNLGNSQYVEGRRGGPAVPATVNPSCQACHSHSTHQGPRR